MYKLVIIDDEIGMLHFLEKLFQIKGFDVHTFSTGLEGYRFIKQNSSDAVLLDVKLPDIDGMEILNKIKKIDKNIPVVVMTAYGDIESAVEFMKKGAYDYITKPFPKEKVIEVIKNCCEKYALFKENIELKKEILKAGFSPDDIVYRSREMGEVLGLARSIAPADSTVIIHGETGTGKELVAKYIHYFSDRKDNVFLPVNCSTLTENLFESHLFGHIKGAFTGALKDQKGILREIDGGTLFLDEITEISPKIQAKLLRLIQEKEFIPVGSSKVEKVNIRVIAATNKDLFKEVESGNFRKDLYYRLNVISINIPPLRERKDDIEPLIKHFVKIYSVKFKKVVRGIAEEVLSQLKKYQWHGNIRELQNIIERSVLLMQDNILKAEYFPRDMINLQLKEEDESIILPLDEVVRNYIKRIYLITGKNKLKTAELLKISRKTIDRKLKE
jgi:two-component system response regulator HydG